MTTVDRHAPHDRPAPIRPGSILGTRVLRTEDPKLLTGAARYVADLPHDGRLHAVFVRSGIAHGLLHAVHTADAAAMPGVVAVWTADELGIAPHHGFVAVHDDFKRPPLATDRVRFVGDAFAVVLAENAAQAEDAAAAVWADIEPLRAHIDPEEALADGAEAVFPAHGSNLALTIPDPTGLDPAIGADVVVRGRYVNQRIAVAAMEPDCFAAAPAPDGRVTVWPSTQMPHMLQGQLASALGWDAADVHVITPQVGGGFGGKAGLHPEYGVVAHAARRLGRPVVWVPSRSEDMLALPHSRAQVQYAELGCTREGTFTGLRVRIVGDAGAYPTIGAFLAGGTRRMSPGNYRFPAIDVSVAVAVTNTTPTGAYRGAGRPEATAMIERLVGQAALELGIDPIELRLRNFLPDDAFPFTSLTGNVYDSGEYALPLRTAAAEIGYEALRAEQRERRARGDRTLLGIGVASYVEITAGGGASEFGAVEVHDDGSATVRAGTSAHGQGHETAFAMIVSDRTGIAVDRIRLVDGDTDRVPRGGGTGGSRSLQLAGSAVRHATDTLVDRARRLAAELLEADAADIVVDTAAGTLGVAGVPSSALGWGALAQAVRERGGADATLDAEHVFDQAGATFPFGAHIAAVEIDADTGRVTLRRIVAVDDCGTVINPVLVEGQQHGGLAAGIAQALYEEVRYDADGNPLATTFAEYALPSAAELPMYDVHSTQTPSPLNPLGAKGIGEASTIGSTPAVQNAVVDALAHLGVRHVDLPCTPERVWRTIADAERGAVAEPWREPPAVFATLGARPAAAADEAGIDAAEGV